MPELPEVETTRRGIEPYVVDQTVTEVVVREPRMRWPVPETLNQKLVGHRFTAVERRGKYLLLRAGAGTLLVHLGMSGSFRVLKQPQPAQKHDHVDILLQSGNILRYNDPRRFGSLLWVEDDPMQHPLLKPLGPEPLSDIFTGLHLFQRAQGRSVPVKSFIMDSRVVVGVGNIYANEALFFSGIHPNRAAGRISRARYEILASHIKQVLQRSIALGGTTLRDFVGGDGKPGYFQQTLQVYGRGGEPCRVCSGELKEVRLGQRSTVYCPTCQK